MEVPQLCHAGEVERRKAHEIGFRGALRPEKLFATMQPAGMWGISSIAIVTGEFQPRESFGTVADATGAAAVAGAAAGAEPAAAGAEPWLGLPESSPAGRKQQNKKAKAVWALGNVAGDSPTCRDLVLGHGALLPLLAQLNEHSKLSMLRNATWTLSNFCRGKPPAPFEQVVKAALPVLRQLIHMNDEEVLTDACWALSYLSDGPNDKIQAVIESGVCPRLVELLLHPSAAVLIPALRTVGNIVTGDDTQTQYVIDNQVLPCLYQLLTQNHKKSIKKEACWTISNITAGNRAQIQALATTAVANPQPALIDIKLNLVGYIGMIFLPPYNVFQSFVLKSGDQAEYICSYSAHNFSEYLREDGGLLAKVDEAVIDANIILPLVYVLQNAEFDIKKEAAWAISNATSGGSHEQIRFLVNQGCIKPLCDLLVCPDPRIITVCLEGLENILKVGEADKEMGLNDGINLYAQIIDECEGSDKLEHLQTHDNQEIYEKAVKILEKFWSEEESEQQNIGDGVDGNQQAFSFGENQPNVPPGGFQFG
nr:importin subunit alpha-4 [Ipomoea batatas]